MWGLHDLGHRFGPRGGGGGHGPFGGWSGDRDGFGRAWGGRGEGRGGRRRQFDGEELKLLLLALTAEGPRHGYDLIREIEERTGGAYAPSPGVVYPTLTLLDEMALIEEVKEDGARRRFAITDAGRAYLTEKRADADALLARLTGMGAERSRTDHAPIRRAMTSLHLALRATLHAEDADAERAHQIAAILDETAQRIERL